MSVHKARRLIVPTLVVEDVPVKEVGNIAVLASGTEAQQRLRVQMDKIIEKYSKVGRKKKSLDEAHGKHHEHLHDFASYTAEYLKMVNHTGKIKESEYSFLEKQFKAGKYYSAKTHRFRKL